MKKKQHEPYGDHRYKPINLSAAFEKFKKAIDNEYESRKQELANAHFKELKKADLEKRKL